MAAGSSTCVSFLIVISSPCSSKDYFFNQKAGATPLPDLFSDSIPQQVEKCADNAQALKKNQGTEELGKEPMIGRGVNEKGL